jgi:tetratricopeptide (TPR) repeat protein
MNCFERLLTYYSILSSFVPQIYAKELIGPAVECLVDAQRNHPSSCFFLFYAARISRVARNIPLSTQSFSFAAESSKGEWAEMAMHQMADYETGFNYVLQLDWASAAIYFEKLSRDQYYWSPAFCQYFIAACKDMMGHRTESILAFAEVTPLVKKSSYIDAYVQEKVEFFQRSGYQDIEFSLPGLEILLVWNAFEQMEKGALEQTLSLVQVTLERIYEREKLEYNIRLKELAPSATPPDYYDQRSILLLIKASVLNALKRHNESIAHLNWIMDHKKQIKSETWVIPFTYWGKNFPFLLFLSISTLMHFFFSCIESGVTSWGLGNYAKSRKLWELALSCTKYTFEYRMAVRLSLALSKCDEIGITVIDSKKQKGLSTNGRKRMAIIDV